MAIKAKDIYQGRKKTHSRAGVIITVILALIVAAVLLFYGLRHYAVYDESGNATIVLPWFHKEQADDATQSPSVSPEESTEPSPSDNTTAN